MTATQSTSTSKGPVHSGTQVARLPIEPNQAPLGRQTIRMRAAHSRPNIDLAPGPWVLIKPLRFLSSELRRAADLGGALAHLGRLDEARSAVKAGLALNPAFSISRARANWTAMSDDPRYLAQNDRFYEGMRQAGVPEQ